MPATLSGSFMQVFIGNAAGALTDISPYLTSVETQRASDATDLTTFASGGGPAPANVIRGAAISEITLHGLYDSVFAKIVRQIVAPRSGVTLLVKAGSHAAPAQGDESFQGTYTCLNYNLNYSTGANATLDLDLKPADGGAITPAFGTI